jgi:hypothetical protein
MLETETLLGCGEEVVAGRGWSFLGLLELLELPSSGTLTVARWVDCEAAEGEVMAVGVLVDVREAMVGRLFDPVATDEPCELAEFTEDKCAPAADHPLLSTPESSASLKSPAGS